MTALSPQQVAGKFIEYLAVIERLFP